ncbi:MAG TPA: hypothetical protein VFL13_06590 [Candidatus Baltobacteraceae bacterium]|nr:hypothetical protein [Candidatus Baltobacteraceae bacterium]
MSKAKTPREKKQLSLKRDHRATPPANGKPNPKNVAAAKRRSHQQERHAVDQVLHTIGPVPDEDELIDVEIAAKVTGQQQHSRAFKKTPDVPLKKVVEAKSERRNGTTKK